MNKEDVIAWLLIFGKEWVLLDDALARYSIVALWEGRSSKLLEFEAPFKQDNGEMRYRLTDKALEMLHD